MPIPVRLTRVLVAVTLATAGAGLLALLSAPCLGDVAPESGLLMHVWGDSLITDCNEIVRTTDAVGSVTFMLFFMRGAYSWEGETICLSSLDNELAWPETWQLLDFWATGDDAWLDPSGPTHALHIEWEYYPYEISDAPQGIVPVAVFVMDVGGTGKLDLVAHYYQNPVELRHDCYGAPFITYPAQAFAEAGMQCGHVSPHCGYRDNLCQAIFDVPELRLSAPSGSTADSTVTFWAVNYQAHESPCPQEVETHAPWCTAWIDPVYDDREYLHVSADAAGLEPGEFETQIELYNTFWGVSRCLSVVFTVEQASAISPMTWGRIKSLFR